jgi:hypothetical protein
MENMVNEEQGQIEIIKKAFLMAMKGFRGAVDALLDEDNSRERVLVEKLLQNMEPSPVAAEIYRQMTSVIVLTLGSDEHRVPRSHIDMAAEQLRKAEINSPYLVGSHDLQFFSTNMDRIELIIKRMMETTEEDNSEEGSCGHK